MMVVVTSVALLWKKSTTLKLNVSDPADTYIFLLLSFQFTEE